MKLSPMRIKYLLTLLQFEGRELSVTHLANLYGVAKSTISRTMDYFATLGLVYDHSLRLTPFGERKSKQFNKDWELLTNWLIKHYQISKETAQEDALIMLAELSEDTLEGIKKKAILKGNLLTIQRNLPWGGIDEIRRLEDGMYAFNFTFYRINGDTEKFISMADDGFVHEGVLIMNKGEGLLRLEGKTVENESLISGLQMHGILKKLCYWIKGEYQEARKENEFFYIPLKALEVKWYEEEQRLHGYVKTKMQINISPTHMPQGEAMLTINL